MECVFINEVCASSMVDFDVADCVLGADVHVDKRGCCVRGFAEVGCAVGWSRVCLSMHFLPAV
jgi:hypothetical protein